MLTREGTIRNGEVEDRLKVRKEIGLRGGQSEFKVKYELHNPGERRIESRFAVEFNVALLAGDAHDRRLFSDEGDLGALSSRHALPASRLIGARDEYLGLSTGIVSSRAGGSWIFPIRTVSLSEGGFEAVYQSTIFMPWWMITIDPGESWGIEIRQFVLPAGEEIRYRRRR